MFQLLVARFGFHKGHLQPRPATRSDLLKGWTRREILSLALPPSSPFIRPIPTSHTLPARTVASRKQLTSLLEQPQRRTEMGLYRHPPGLRLEIKTIRFRSAR